MATKVDACRYRIIGISFISQRLCIFISIYLQMDPESDKKISDHVLRMHKYRTIGEQDGDGK